MFTLRRRNGATLLDIDDDSTRLVYDGSWDQTSVDTQDGAATVHASTTSGSTVKFAFNGTFVAVYGVVDGGDSVTASFQLDDGELVTPSVPQPSDGKILSNWPFFSTSPPITPGLHELTITLKKGTFNLDYIQYTTLDGNKDSTGDPVQVPATSPPLRSLESGPARGQLPSAAIAGIVVAAVLLVIGVVVIAIFVRRRSARRVRHRKLDSEKPIDIIYENAPMSPPVAAAPRNPFRRLSRVYRPTPARSTQSSKTTASSAPTSITQSSAMFTSVIMLSPALSMVSEESGQQDV